MNYLKKEEFDREVQKRNRIRYYTILGYLILTTIAILFPLISSFNDTTTIFVIPFILLAGIITLIIVLVKPYFDRIYPEITVEDGKRVPIDKYLGQIVYYEEVKLTILYYLVILFLILYALLVPYLYVTEGLISSFIGLLAANFFLLILILFDRIKISLDNDILLFQLGPFKDSLPVSDIVKSEVIQVRPLRDYLGYGKRLGPDGSIGYIARGSLGVKLLMKNSKIYVISTPNAHSLIKAITRSPSI